MLEIEWRKTSVPSSLEPPKSDNPDPNTIKPCCINTLRALNPKPCSHFPNPLIMILAGTASYCSGIYSHHPMKIVFKGRATTRTIYS